MDTDEQQRTREINARMQKWVTGLGDEAMAGERCPILGGRQPEARAAEWALQEIERLRRYADAMNGKPGTERHIYNGACPDNGQPDSRDPECPACRLLVPNATELTGAEGVRVE